MHRHTVTNSALTSLSNWLTDLDLTDIETCYKAVNATLLQSIPIRSDDFRFAVEIVFKLAKRRARVFEVPIRYLPRTQEEGKKIRAPDRLLAVIAMLRFALVDDLYREDEYGSHILVELERVRHLNLWMGRTLRPYVGDRVLEIDAGIANLTRQFIPRELYVASDLNPHYLHDLRSYSFGKPYLRVLEIDAGNPAHFRGLEAQFDTALMINVLEHLPDEQWRVVDINALRALAPPSLRPGSQAVRPPGPHAAAPLEPQAQRCFEHLHPTHRPRAGERWRRCRPAGDARPRSPPTLRPQPRSRTFQPRPPCRSPRRGEVRVERLADLHHLLAGEAAAGGEVGDRFEVAVLSARQAPVERIGALHGHVTAKLLGRDRDEERYGHGYRRSDSSSAAVRSCATRSVIWFCPG
jgi:hypothetical protein